MTMSGDPEKRLQKVEETLQRLEAALGLDADSDSDSAPEAQSLRTQARRSTRSKEAPAPRRFALPRSPWWIVGAVVVAAFVLFVILPLLTRLLVTGLVILVVVGVIWYGLRRLSASGKT